MRLSYEHLVKRPLIFLRMSGVTEKEFKEMCSRIKPLWEKEIEEKKKRHGRSSPLKTFEDKLLVLLIYYRTYITHEFLGYLFGLHNANICRLFKKLEPIVARKLAIKKDRTLTEEAIIKLLADVTETPIQRPSKKKKNKETYSGKKKRHTLKTEIVMTDNGKILSTSHTHGGRTHDFKIRKQEKPFPKDPEKYVDLGYQGLQKISSHVNLPFKRSKKSPLMKEQKDHNRALASFRMKVEHKIRELKIFHILSGVYRNFQKKYHLRFNIIAGIVNLKHGF